MERIEIDTLGPIIKAARKSRGHTREQLAEQLHITPRYLMSIENENQKPSYDVLFRLIRKLGISADSVFYLNNGRNILASSNREFLKPYFGSFHALNYGLFIWFALCFSGI